MNASKSPESPESNAVTLPGRPCSAAAALHVVGEKWALLAVREIFFGNHRFEAIARNTGAPRDRVAARLRALEQAGVVERRPYNERPPRYEYHLTASGRDLAPVIRALLDWGDRWVNEEPPVVLVHEPGNAGGGEPGDGSGDEDGHTGEGTRGGRGGNTGEGEHSDEHGHGRAHDLDAAWVCRTCGEEIAMNTLTADVRAPGWDRAGPLPEPLPSPPSEPIPAE
ncbi:helix-turn-helix transcriptional regulator [Streptomyces sp. NBC_01433]|uniref:winged helix-turn-helix transcriptional regulator n=1 Tax=Streptomyces sp. NBC_01433 TaxID=2903864 RepID=UPI002259B393|nr:helix-turn-helix domain-containing protein [Streptomyces sp. NBC_01433]MCX4676122.1 helix-turn-helix transcriptional regulator [Streptomyces sp. NBC_01433]